MNFSQGITLACAIIFHLNDFGHIYNHFIGIRIAQKFGSTEALKAYGAKPLIRLHPACRAHSYDSDEYWQCFVRHNAIGMFHYQGTCRMGPKSDNNTVVDAKLR